MGDTEERNNKRPGEDKNLPTASFGGATAGPGRRLLGPKKDMFSV